MSSQLPQGSKTRFARFYRSRVEHLLRPLCEQCRKRNEAGRIAPAQPAVARCWRCDEPSHGPCEV